jgi:1-acyl-sn-glycerol-3-phosphate acyltransferase
MSLSYSVPLYNRVFRRLLRPPFRLLFHILSPVTIIGRSNVPRRGGYLIVINHVSLFEAPFLGTFWPTPPDVVGAVEIWQRPGQSLLARMWGGIQVHRGEYDRHLLDTMVAALQAGRPLLIAPEGGRSHTPGMRRALPGAAYVADRAGVPVVPVGLIGTTQDYFTRAIHRERPPLEMRIGQPFHLPPVEGKGAERRLILENHMDQIMRRLAELLPPEYRGVYAESVSSNDATAEAV